MLKMSVSAYDVMYYNSNNELCVEKVWGSTPELCAKLIQNKCPDYLIWDVHLCEGAEAATKELNVDAG